MAKLCALTAAEISVSCLFIFALIFILMLIMSKFTSYYKNFTRVKKHNILSEISLKNLDIVVPTIKASEHNRFGRKRKLKKKP